MPSENTLALVSIAENSDTNWRKQLNYIEDIQDGRGFTISIVGFCTGTGDFLQVVQRIAQLNSNHPLVKFLPALVAVNATSCHSGLDLLPQEIKRLGTQESTFNQAVFDLVKLLYWGPSQQYCNENNLSSELSRYIIYDTLLNFGTLDYFKDIPASKESEYLERFLDVKECVIEQCGNLGDSGKEVNGVSNRVDMQRAILKQGNFDLTSPLKVDCYGSQFVV
jgi:chitosanase